VPGGRRLNRSPRANLVPTQNEVLDPAERADRDTGSIDATRIVFQVDCVRDLLAQQGGVKWLIGLDLRDV
jgi:hypothetical protein